MKWLQTAAQVILLFGFYYIGVFIQELFKLRFPGSIIGMLLLLFFLKTGAVKPVWVKEGSSFLLKHLTLLFIPATVGVIQYLNLFTGYGLVSIVVVIVSSMLVFSSSILLFGLLAKMPGKEKAAGKENGRC
ncbi:CidA/LrgA family protein [Metabacillus sp. RGM 3146]|uniref:CidA/LrgA family protein n=1 Tax=Metabacillus sp. RGM 3146 TaxID=3401092 RepID=UPI003B9AE65A